jgi:hypothetical protein
MPKEEVRFSPNFLTRKQAPTPTEKNTKTAKATKRANTKSKEGKYVAKVVDGVKYMVLSRKL